MSFSRETTHTAKKPHRCECCGKTIEAGSRYVRWAGLTDGDFASVAMHEDCRAWEVFLNQELYQRDDEWMILHEVVANDPTMLDGAPDAVRARFPKALESLTAN